jgi:hypothetical protein
MKGDSEKVTLCIPTWESEAFIGAAINDAAAQRHENLEILISIDLSRDNTIDVCRERARTDPRIHILEQKTRLGWTENVNALIDAVETNYYAIYFHDDAVSPEWIGALLDVLRQRPDAGAAYCAIEEGEKLACGQDHDGNAFERLMTRLVGEPKGSPLRALTRKSALKKPARFPKVSLLGYHAQHAYLFDLIAAAPLLYVPETLYVRQHEREGGVTSKWKSLPPTVIEEDLKATAAAIGKTIADKFCAPGQREILEQCAKLVLSLQYARSEIQYGFRRPVSLDDVLPGCENERAISLIAAAHPRFLDGYEKLRGQITATTARKEKLDRECDAAVAP